MTGPILVFSNVIIDHVRDAGGVEHAPSAGGAGLFAAAGASAWWKPVALVAGVGEDFDTLTGGLADAYGFDRRGLVFRGPHSIQSRLIYEPDGGRSETPIMGADHFRRLQLTPADLDESLLPAAGTYLFRDDDPDFWAAVEALRPSLGRILWEIDCRLARPEKRAAFGKLASQVDIVSLNLAEGQAMLGPLAPGDLAAGLISLGCSTVLLRMGAEGALVAGAGVMLHVTTPAHRVVDVTGGGNAFSGGFLAGYCARPGDLDHASRCAAAAAAHAISEPGVPPPAAPDLLIRLARDTGVRVLPHSIGAKHAAIR
jgi:sugar/nucleoside kinase (ribokinase family)